MTRLICYLNHGNIICGFPVSGKYKEMVLGVENIIQVDYWDFGGQLIFYTTHPTYMSDRCVYFLVFDCSIGLQGEVRDPDVDTDVNTNKTAMGKLWLFHISATGYQIFPYEHRIERQRELSVRIST